MLQAYASMIAGLASGPVGGQPGHLTRACDARCHPSCLSRGRPCDGVLGRHFSPASLLIMPRMPSTTSTCHPGSSWCTATASCHVFAARGTLPLGAECCPEPLWGNECQRSDDAYATCKAGACAKVIGLPMATGDAAAGATPSAPLASNPSDHVGSNTTRPSMHRPRVFPASLTPASSAPAPQAPTA